MGRNRKSQDKLGGNAMDQQTVEKTVEKSVEKTMFVRWRFSVVMLTARTAA